MGENISNNNEYQDNGQAEKWAMTDDISEGWDSLSNVKNDEFNPEPEMGTAPEATSELSAEQLLEFRDKEIANAEHTLSEQMMEYKHMANRFQHEPSVALRERLDATKRKIDVDSDFYGLLSDPDDDRTSSEIYNSLSAKYLRIAERGLKSGNTEFADDYGERAKLARHGAEVALRRQEDFGRSKRPKSGKKLESIVLR